MPRLDSLLESLRKALEDPGAKAEFARLLQRERGIGFQAAKNLLSRHLHGKQVPNGEDALRIAEFLATR